MPSNALMAGSVVVYAEDVLNIERIRDPRARFQALGALVYLALRSESRILARLGYVPGLFNEAMRWDGSSRRTLTRIIERLEEHATIGGRRVKVRRGVDRKLLVLEAPEPCAMGGAQQMPTLGPCAMGGARRAPESTTGQYLPLSPEDQREAPPPVAHGSPGAEGQEAVQKPWRKTRTPTPKRTRKELEEAGVPASLVAALAAQGRVLENGDAAKVAAS